MRTTRLGVGLLGLILLTTSGRAGIYLPPKYGPFPPSADPRYFKLRLDDRRALLATKRKKPTKEEREKSPVLNETWEDIEALEKKRAANTLTVEEGIRLGGYYLLAKDHAGEALEVLKEVQQREPNHFMLLGNLATAYFLLGVPDRAVLTQMQMLDVKVWPRESADWSPARLYWQRRVETFYLAFLRGRAEASRLEAQPGARKPLQLEPLFPGVRFVGRDGKYAAGEIDPRMMDRLPPDAIPIVQQLILWLPEGETLGLIWLLAELFNAHGEVRAAAGLMDQLVGTLGTVPELAQHRRVVKQAVDALPPEKTETEKQDDPGPLVDNTPGVLPNWRTFGIGVGVGVLVGILLVLQWRQFFRPTRR